MAIFLQKNGHRVLVVTNKYSKTALPYEKMNGIEVHRFWFYGLEKYGIYSIVHICFTMLIESVSIKLNRLIADLSQTCIQKKFLTFSALLYVKIKSLEGRFSFRLDTMF